MLDAQGYTPVLCLLGSLHVLAAVLVLIMVRRKRDAPESGAAAPRRAGMAGGRRFDEA
jgi:hypothetical protein